MSVKSRRLRKLEGIKHPSNKPEPSGVAVYIPGDGSRYFETGMRQWYSSEELNEIYEKYGIGYSVIIPDNGREVLNG